MTDPTTPAVTTTTVDGQTVSTFATPTEKTVTATETVTPTETTAATTANVGEEPGSPGYTPTFGAKTRTVVYITCAILGILGILATLASTLTGAPQWLTFASAALAIVAPYVANLFGVAYNPLKMAGK